MAANYIQNFNPTTGENLGYYQIASQKEVDTAMAYAREAWHQWKEISLAKRSQVIANVRKELTENMGELVDTVCTDTGKVRQEALMADIYPTLELVKYYENNITKVLSAEKRATPLSAIGNVSWVEYHSRGVVAVISPWNYPLQLALVPVITAVAAGNAVLLKPSEITPLTGEKIKELLAGVPDFPLNLVQVLQGNGIVGQRIIKAEPDMIFFTGSVSTGKKIMSAAAEKLIPVELELGGKDPFIVLEDANLERTVNGAIYGAFANTGQLCVSAERIYVQESILDDFICKAKEKTSQLKVNQGFWGDIGPFTHPEQKKHVTKQIHEALDQGAKIVNHDVQKIKQQLSSSGKAGELGDRLDNQLEPIILSNVNHAMDIMFSETFGPVMPIMSFSSDEEAITLANSSRYGLNASVWSRDINRAKYIASRLETGNCMINDVLRNVGNPYLPFGGVKQSGLGRYHGPEGLRNFSHIKSIMHNKSQRTRELNWFPFSKEMHQSITEFLTSYFRDRWIVAKMAKVSVLFLQMLRKISNK